MMGTTIGDAASLLGSGKENCIDLPPGFRFHPSDEEIVTHYLYERVKDAAFSAIAIGEADLNKSEPWDLPKLATMGEKEWYFFCERDKKYPTGMRTNRATKSGYWKATGKDKEIYKGKACLVGMKKTLVFYLGRAPKGEKTNWVMHEYRLEAKTSYWKLPKFAKDEWVVCRVFHKSIGLKKKPETGDGAAFCPMINPSAAFRDDDISSAALPPLAESPYLMSNPHNPGRTCLVEGGTHFRETQPTGATPSMPPYMRTTAEQYQAPDIHNSLPLTYFNGTTNTAATTTPTMPSNIVPPSLSHHHPTPNAGYYSPHGEDYYFGKRYGAAAPHHADVTPSSPLRRQYCKVEQLHFPSNHSGIGGASPETSGVHGGNHELYNDIADWQISSRTTLADLDNLLNKYS